RRNMRAPSPGRAVAKCAPDPTAIETSLFNQSISVGGRGKGLATHGSHRAHESAMLDEDVILGSSTHFGHRTLPIKPEPFLRSVKSKSACHIEEKCHIEHNRRRQN